MFLPALALIVGAAGSLAIAAATLPSGDTPAQPAPAVQTLNDTDTPDITVPPCGVTTIPYTTTDSCVNTDGQLTPVTPAPTPEPVQTLNAPQPQPLTTQPLTATPTPTPTTTPQPPQPKACAPWMEPGWAGASCIWAMPNAGGTLELKACANEDSQNCYWDATMRGNGQGRSFINIRGHLFYEEAGR